MVTPEFESGIQTVRHLTKTFEKLTLSVRQVADQIDPVSRGYFTASEDESVQALLVSYWQTRCASLELIQEWRKQQPAEEPGKSIYFLMGFCTALLLVDAARLLRQETESRPVVRRKLNQPLPEFGIAGGCYDAVQRSLMSTRNAWHLYHARAYFRNQEERLSQVAVEFKIEDILGSIHRLWESIDVSFRQFARHSVRTRGDQVIRRIGRSLFQRAIYGIQKLGSEMMANVYVQPGHQPAIPEQIAGDLAAYIRPGDVLVVRKEHALTNYFLPGYWPHAALYLGQPQELEQMDVSARSLGQPRWEKIVTSASQSGRAVLESMKDGVLIRCWGSPLASDSFVLIRPGMSEADIAVGIGRAMAHEGKGYDFDFNFARSDQLVCTEVVYRAYQGLGGMDFPLKKRAGRPTMSGSDLVEFSLLGEQWTPVAAFVPAKSPELKIGEEAAAVIRSVVE